MKTKKKSQRCTLKIAHHLQTDTQPVPRQQLALPVMEPQFMYWAWHSIVWIWNIPFTNSGQLSHLCFHLFLVQWQTTRN